MPKLWNETIETHRREVRDAILHTTAALVAERGLRAVTMSEVAEKTGIGRATLYKYFPSIDSILSAWHEGRIAAHLEQFAEMRNLPGAPGERLEALLEAYAHILREKAHGHGDAELEALMHQLHQGEQGARARHQVRDMIRERLSGIAEKGELRDDVPLDELASYCLHAIEAARKLPSRAAVHRLVGIILAGLQRPGR
jgi:AcrR family transcriptional regulator